MRPTVEQFVQRLTDSGLLTADEIAAVQRKLDDDACDAQTFARRLVDEKRLTPYQAKAIWNGKSSSLVLGNYVILDKLGQGGMGVVYQARHRRMGRVVALKTLSPSAAENRDLVARFQREVQAAARLSHPNIVTAHDADEANGVHFLVMEFVKGTDLAELVKQRGALSVPQSIDCILQAAQGLKYAHAAGVIHRDIKPSNLLIDKQGTIKILDMGLARLDETMADESTGSTQPSLTQTGIAMGTADYMSPEQALDTRHADAVSDIYSLGCTLYFLLVGRPVYEQDTPIKKIFAHRDDPIPSLLDKMPRSDCPRETLESLDAIYQKMVAKQPQDRYQSMGELIPALQAIGEDYQQSSAALSVAAVANRDDSAYHSFLAGLKGEADATVPTGVAENFDGTPSPDKSTAQAIRVGSPQPQPQPKPAASSFLTRRVAIGGSIGALLLVGMLIWMGAANNNPPVIPAANGNSHAGSTVVDRHAIVFNGEGDYVEVKTLNLDDFDVSQPLTIEAMLSLHRDQRCNAISWFGEHWIALFHMNGEGWGAGRLLESGSLLQKDRVSLRTDTPVHVAVVWDGSEFRLYQNGERRDLQTMSFNLRPTEGGLFIGGAPPEKFNHEDNSSRWFSGVIDEIRISKVARYNGPFEPQATPRFEPDDDTLALYHCDESTGTRLIDASGNGHHGEIHGTQRFQTGFTKDSGEVDVLRLVDVSRDAQQNGGTWVRTGDVLRSPQQEFGRISVPVAPRIDYRLNVEFQRLEGNDAIDIFLPIDTRQVIYVFDGFEGKGISGLQAVNRRDQPGPEHGTGVAHSPLVNGRWYRAEITVTAEGDDATIRVSLDGEPFSEWTGPISSLKLIDTQFEFDDSRRVGLGAWKSIVEFRRLGLTMLEGEAQILRPVVVSE